MVYRQIPEVSPAALQTVQGADHVPVPEIQGEEPVGNLWYWVRSGFVITVGAGLIGIGVGLLALLAVWYRPEPAGAPKKMPAPHKRLSPAAQV